MKAISTDRRTLQLSHEGVYLGQLAYTSLLSYQAKIVLANFEEYKIQPKGFFGTTIQVIQTEIEIARLEMNWKGQMMITFADGRVHFLKWKGALRHSYFIENAAREKLFALRPRFIWKKMNFDFDISYDRPPENILLVFLGVYGANYLTALMSSG